MWPRLYNEPLAVPMGNQIIYGDGQHLGSSLVLHPGVGHDALALIDMSGCQLNDFSIEAFDCNTALRVGIYEVGHASDWNTTHNLNLDCFNVNVAALYMYGSGDAAHFRLHVATRWSNAPGAAVVLDGSGGQTFYSPELHTMNPKADVMILRGTGRVTFYDGYLDNQGVSDGTRGRSHIYIEANTQHLAIKGAAVWGADNGYTPNHNFGGPGSTLTNLDVDRATTMNAAMSTYQPGLNLVGCSNRALLSTPSGITQSST